MFAKLTALVGGGFSLPYTLGQPYESSWGSWTHYPATSKEDSKPVSVFKISAEPEDRRLVVARNGIKRLKIVRSARSACASAAAAPAP